VWLEQTFREFANVEMNALPADDSRWGCRGRISLDGTVIDGDGDWFQFENVWGMLECKIARRVWRPRFGRNTERMDRFELSGTKFGQLLVLLTEAIEPLAEVAVRVV
jgi:hypothetical protein